MRTIEASRARRRAAVYFSRRTQEGVSSIPSVDTTTIPIWTFPREVSGGDVVLNKACLPPHDAQELPREG